MKPFQRKRTEFRPLAAVRRALFALAGPVRPADRASSAIAVEMVNFLIGCPPVICFERSEAE